MEPKGKRIRIAEVGDVALAVFDAKNFAKAAGFKQNEQFMIATAVSELATNISRYAEKGDITLRIIDNNLTKGVEIVAEDHGSGIEDLEKALQDHFQKAIPLYVASTATWDNPS